MVPSHPECVLELINTARGGSTDRTFPAPEHCPPHDGGQVFLYCIMMLSNIATHYVSAAPDEVCYIFRTQGTLGDSYSLRFCIALLETRSLNFPSIGCCVGGLKTHLSNQIMGCALGKTKNAFGVYHEICVVENWNSCMTTLLMLSWGVMTFYNSEYYVITALDENDLVRCPRWRRLVLYTLETFSWELKVDLRLCDVLACQSVSKREPSTYTRVLLRRLKTLIGSLNGGARRRTGLISGLCPSPVKKFRAAGLWSTRWK
ncbi:hypothetical protein PSPO01_06053 [Paraphaeosphaeria sporulosa]